MQYRALVLDETYYPIQIIGWKQAMRLSFSGRAEVVEHHEDSSIRSPGATFKVPKVMRIFQKIITLRGVRFNRYNVFLRDNFSCQYCGMEGNTATLSLDHVVPKSHGGKTTWENIVTCCYSCNNKKADKSPLECGLRLKKRPARPSWGPLWGMKLCRHEYQWWGDWIKGQVFKLSA